MSYDEPNTHLVRCRYCHTATIDCEHGTSPVNPCPTDNDYVCDDCRLKEEPDSHEQSDQ